MPYFDVRVLKIDEPLASSLAGFPKKGRPEVRRAGARGQRLALVVVVVVSGRRRERCFERPFLDLENFQLSAGVGPP